MAMRAMWNLWDRGLVNYEFISALVTRIYFHKRGKTIIVLLCGGDKSTQAKDTKAAKRLVAEWIE